MRNKTLLALVALLAFSSLVTAQIPTYDKAKHYQLRSMETGPWEFHPPGWYYSWWTKDGKFLWIWDVSWKLPGLGIHDKGPAGIGGGDQYVRRYSPNSTRRALMLIQAKQTKKKYEATTASIKEVSKRELLDATDRTVDIVYQDYALLYDKLNLLMFKKIAEYRKIVGSDEQLLNYITEHNKIRQTIDYMRHNYVKNVDRQKVYSSELKKLEALIIRCNNVIKVHYMYNVLVS